MADLPELSDSTKRKLALQWSALLDTNRLTGEHFQWHERERDRLRRIAAQSPGPGPDWRNERAADETGIRQSVTVAEARFKDLSGEYWCRWLSSGDGYEAFVGWLEELKRRVSSEVASVWKGKSKPIDSWYERACGPAVEKTLAVLVKEGTNRARGAEMKRLETGAQPKDDSDKGAEAVPSIIGKLPKDTLVRMEAATAAFIAEYVPKLEREANKRGQLHDVELLRELVIHQFNLVARECMAVCASVEEFEAELHSDIARFVRYGLSQYRWLADPMLNELDTGFTFFVMRVNPWAEIPAEDRASAWHVGATIGEALSHAALKLRAEAWTRAAAGGFPKPAQAGTAEPSGEESSRTDAGPVVSGPHGNRADPTSSVRQRTPPEPVISRAEPFRFQVALSFPGGHRSRVERVAEALAASVGRERVLYDRWHEAEFARPNLDVYLAKLYHEQSLLLVFFLCAEYVQKDWCGLEWRAGRDLLKKDQNDRLMFLRLDREEIPGLYSIDGYLDITDMPDDQVADKILQRLALLVSKPAGPHRLSA
jgi:hypothetical protein